MVRSDLFSSGLWRICSIRFSVHVISPTMARVVSRRPTNLGSSKENFLLTVPSFFDMLFAVYTPTPEREWVESSTLLYRKQAGSG